MRRKKLTIIVLIAIMGVYLVAGCPGWKKNMVQTGEVQESETFGNKKSANEPDAGAASANKTLKNCYKAAKKCKEQGICYPCLEACTSREGDLVKKNAVSDCKQGKPNRIINKTESETSGEFNEPQEKYAVIAAGTSRDDLHAKWYRNAITRAYKILTKEYDYSDEEVYVMSEDPSQNRNIVDKKSTKTNFIKTIYELKSKVSEETQIFFYLVGHGSSNSYDLVGEDLTAGKFGEELDKLNNGRTVIVLTPCGSGGFIKDLSGEKRIVITSTRPYESNRADFAGYIITAFKNKENDENGDGRVSFLEAYNSALEDVKKWYSKRNISQIKEHALLDDNGDGKAEYGEKPDGEDGYLAAETYP